MNTEKQQRTAAVAFARRWEGRGYEKGESQNDRLVMQAYGFPTKMTESECVTELFRRYGEMVE